MEEPVVHRSSDWYMKHPLLSDLESILSYSDSTPFYTFNHDILQGIGQVLTAAALRDSGLVLTPGGMVYDFGSGGVFALHALRHEFSEMMASATLGMVDIGEPQTQQAYRVARAFVKQTPPRQRRGFQFAIEAPQDLADLDIKYRKLLRHDIPDGQDVMSYLNGLDDEAFERHLEELDFEKTYTEPRPKNTLTWSTSVLHWMEIERMRQALIKMSRMSDNWTPAAFCVSAPGSGDLLTQAFYQELLNQQAFDVNYNRRGYTDENLPRNPIGSVDIHTLSNLVDNSGFTVVSADLRTTYVPFDGPGDYFDAFLGYGRHLIKQMAPHYKSKDIKRLTGGARTRYIDLVTRSGSGWNPGRPLIYHQRDDIVIAVSQIPSHVQESLHKRAFDEYQTQARVRDTDRLTVEIQGNSSKIEQIKTTVDMRQILVPIIKACTETERRVDTRGLKVDYRVDGKNFILEVTGSSRKNFEEVYKPPILTIMERMGMGLSYVNNASGRTYKFAIPIAE